MQPLNFAILGPGGIADDQHAPAIKRHPDAVLWSVLSRSPERGLHFANKHGLSAPQPCFSSLDELSADPLLDAVVIATPDRLHAEQVIACARAGKHVLLEKPMATSLAECDAMIRACSENKVTLALAYHLRWHAGHRMVRTRIQEGALGVLRHMRVHWTFAAKDGTNWRSSPETGRWWSLAANGTHCLDLIRWFMIPTEGEIIEVKTLTSNSKFQSPHDETSIVALLFESGATAEICVSVQFESDSRIEVYGDTGSVRMEATMGRHGQGDIYINKEPFPFEPVSPFTGELNNFIECVRNGAQPEVGQLEGKRNVEILLQSIHSSGSDSYPQP
ncbi:Gfo/Idh/MocA family oxidoreductase [bacterium]|nr:Gfo/Idh/MocA family oxidoreductase [bacterium]